MNADIDLDAFVFDLGGVIVAHDNAVMIRALQARSRADARSVIERAISARPYATGEKPISALHEELVATAGYRGGWSDFTADWCCHFTVDPAMLALVDELALSRRVLLFSNTNAEHWDYLVAATGGALARHRAFLSHEMGDAKPSLSSFRIVAEQAGLDPGRTLFTDDRAENVAAAEAMGFQGHVFTGLEGFVQALRARSVPQ